MNWYNRHIKLAMPRAIEWTNEEMEKIKQLLEEGKSFDYIADLFGVSSRTIRNINKNNGLVKSFLSKGKLSKEKIDEIVYFYENGSSVRELSEAYDASSYQIIYALKKRGVYDFGRRFEERKVDVAEENKNDILKKYRAGFGVKELSREYGETRGAIYNHLRNNNIHIRNREEQLNMDHYIQNASEKQRQFIKNNPQAAREHSRKLLEWWRQFGEEPGEKLTNRLLSFPTRQQAINMLRGFAGRLDKDPSLGNGRAVYTKYMDIINNHTFPDEVQQGVTV